MKEDKDPCWKGYEMVGMKKKGGRKVPNCVPVEGYIEIGEPGRGWRNFGDGFNAKKRYGTKPKEKPESNEPGTGDTYKGSNSGKKVRFAKTVKEARDKRSLKRDEPITITKRNDPLEQRKGKESTRQQYEREFPADYARRKIDKGNLTQIGRAHV